MLELILNEIYRQFLTLSGAKVASGRTALRRL